MLFTAKSSPQTGIKHKLYAASTNKARYKHKILILHDKITLEYETDIKTHGLVGHLYRRAYSKAKIWYG